MIKAIVKKFIPAFLLDFYHLSLAFLGAVFYGFPSRKLKVVGVTGTNGKSTVVLMIAKILEGAGLGAASLSSINFKIGDREWANTLKMTMPGRFKIQKFLRQAVNAGCKYAVLEVTSEGIKQNRHKFIDFDTAVFTNLSKEHIERHGSFEKYREAKGELFKACKNIHVINRDDENSDYFWNNFSAKNKVCFTTIGCPTPISTDGCRTSIISMEDIQPLNLKLPGQFNLQNALAAIAVGLAYGIDLEICKRAIESIDSIPGRMEKVYENGFSVIVDYAHTPAALEQVYQTLRRTGFRKPYKLICVLGSAGGGRDKWKRPELGRIAARYCDEIILTNEDPYNESPEKILEDIAKGAPNAQKILDRREAIKKALTLAGHGAKIIIAGKGCEPWMCTKGGKKIPWSDKQIVLDSLEERNNIT